MTSPSTKEVERVFVAVDVMNLWYSGREQFGDGTRVDYDKLLDLLRRPDRELYLVAYTISSYTKLTADGKVKYVGRRNEKFINSLEKLGFSIRDRTIIKEKGVSKPFGTDWDVGIAMDASFMVDEYHTFVLASGDGDYNILLEELRRRGKRIEVITFKSTTSKLLHKPAHQITYLTRNEVFTTNRSYDGEDQKNSS